MKQLVILPLIACLVASIGCKPGTTAKVRDALDKIECKALVLAPLAEYLTSDQFEQSLVSDDYIQVLLDAGITPDNVKNTVQALKACDDK